MSLVRSIAAAAVAAAIAIAVAAAPAAAQPARELGAAALGAQVDRVRVATACSELEAAGSGATALFTTRGQLTRSDGSYRFNGVDADVDTERACGLEPGLRVDAKTGPDDEGLPADPQAYAELLTALASHLDGRVERFAVDNEAAVVNHFPDSPEHYFELLRLASAAIHAGNPDAVVADASTSYGVLGVVLANRLLAEGSAAEALVVIQEVQANELGGGPEVDDEAELRRYLADPQAQRALRFFELAVANQDAYDVFQFHYYGPAARLPQMIDTVRELGIRLPIEIWELNHRYLDLRPYDDAEHAAEAARLLLTAVGEGSRWTIFTSFYDNLDNEDYGLFASTRRPAFESFRTVATALTGATAAARLDSAHGDTALYSFERPRGELLAAWNETATPVVGRTLGIRASSVAVTSTTDGSVRHLDPGRLRAGPVPILIEPDLLEIAKRHGGSRRAYRLTLSCPPGSPFASCAGRLWAIDRHGRPVGKLRFRVARGESERRRLKLDPSGPRGKPAKIVAEAKRCPSRKRHCESRLRL